MNALLLLLLLLTALHHWLLEPLMVAGEALLEVRLLPWLALALLGWVLAGESGQRP